MLPILRLLRNYLQGGEGGDLNGLEVEVPEDEDVGVADLDLQL